MIKWSLDDGKDPLEKTEFYIDIIDVYMPEIEIFGGTKSKNNGKDYVLLNFGTDGFEKNLKNPGLFYEQWNYFIM